MEKKPVSILKVNGYSIYPCIISIKKADKEGFRGVNIRAEIKENDRHESNWDKPSPFDIELKDEKLVRMKGLEFVDGNITKGHTKEIRDKLNARIKFLQVEIYNYFRYNGRVVKDELMTHLYGSNHKSKKPNTYYTVLNVNKDGETEGTEIFTTLEMESILG